MYESRSQLFMSSMKTNQCVRLRTEESPCRLPARANGAFRAWPTVRLWCPNIRFLEEVMHRTLFQTLGPTVGVPNSGTHFQTLGPST